MKNFKNLLAIASFTLLILLAAVNTNAAPLENVPQKITQPDGTVLQCFASGDEFYNWLHCADGYTIIQNPETGFFVFADKVGNELVPTNLIFGINNPQELNLQKRLITPDNPTSNEMRRAFNEQLEIQFLERKERRKEAGSQFQSEQRTINNIVIFIEFADSSFANTVSIKSAKEAEYNTDALSMRAYFEEVSYGQLTVNSHFFPKNGAFKSQRKRNELKRWSSENPEGYFVEYEREREVLREALDAIKHEIPSDLDLDTDNDGEIDAITIIFQGDVVSGTILRAHMWWDLPYLDTLIINGKMFNRYNILLETFSFIGVAAHELFHVFLNHPIYMIMQTLSGIGV